MHIQGIYAALATADIAASEAFYAKLFDRAADDHPMPTLVQRRNVAGANIQLFLDTQNAGKSLCTIVVPNMDDARQSLGSEGITLGDEQAGDFGKIARLSDPDGNQIFLAEPPKGHQRS